MRGGGYALLALAVYVLIGIYGFISGRYGITILVAGYLAFALLPLGISWIVERIKKR